MKAGSFRESIAKTVRLLTRDQVDIQFRGFQPMVLTRGDKVIRMVLPEVGDNASEELITAMNGFLDHECGHIFFTPFKRAADSLKGLGKGEARMRQVMNNIVEDIRLEKLLPRELPGTKDNLERMYDAVMDSFFGKHIQEALQRNAPAEEMMSKCIVVGFRALAGQKAFHNYMDKHQLWPWLTPLTSRIPTLATDLQNMETYDDVERVVQAVLDAMEPKQRSAVEEAFENTPDEEAPGCTGEGDNDPQQPPEPQDDDHQDDASGQEQGDDADDEGNSSEGDAADEGDEGSAGDEADQDGDSDKKSEETGGEGHGDGEGTDDGSDEEGGECRSDETGGEDEGGDAGEDDEDGEEKGGPESDREGKSNQSITDALKQLEPTQRKVLYLHKNKRRSVTRIAEKMQISEDEVKSLLRDARRSLADIMTGSL
jgi:cobalamin biosynthesis protein CobT